jgi:hypothetical protein
MRPGNGMEEQLPHTGHIRRLLRAGKRAEALLLHQARVRAAFEAARRGATINLSDLLAARETLNHDDPACPTGSTGPASGKLS